MAKQRVEHPSQIVKVGDTVTVYVLGVEKARNQISLSLVKP
jgi:uncharacterized protein